VDARDKPGHDAGKTISSHYPPRALELEHRGSGLPNRSLGAAGAPFAMAHGAAVLGRAGGNSSGSDDAAKPAMPPTLAAQS